MFRLSKQPTWIVLLWIIISFDAWANSNAISIKAITTDQDPELYSIRVVPRNPSTGDAIKVQIWAVLSSQTLVDTVTTRYTIDGNIIKIQTNHPHYLPDITDIGYVTTVITPLQVGKYTIEYEYREKTFISTVSPIKDDTDFTDVVPRRTIIPLTVQENIYRIPSLSGINQALLSLLMLSVIAWFNRKKSIFS